MAAVPGRGDVVFVTFPYTDLSDAKPRPAVVLATLRRGDLLICQVTSKSYADPNAIELDQGAFADGELRPGGKSLHRQCVDHPPPGRHA